MLGYLYTNVAVVVWIIPAVFMAGHFLFGWLNFFEEARFTVWLIEQWVSNLGILYHIVGVVFAVLGTFDGTSLYYAALFCLYALAAESLQWNHGIGVIRTIAPNWNKRSGKLYPSFFYALDLVDETSSVSY